MIKRSFCKCFSIGWWKKTQPGPGAASCLTAVSGDRGQSVGQPAAYGDIHRQKTEKTHKAVPLPAVRRHFGKLKWKWIHNGHLALKSYGNNIGQAWGCPAQCVCVSVCVSVNVCVCACLWMIHTATHKKKRKKKKLTLGGFTRFENRFHLKTWSC